MVDPVGVTGSGNYSTLTVEAPSVLVTGETGYWEPVSPVTGSPKLRLATQDDPSHLSRLWVAAPS